MKFFFGKLLCLTIALAFTLFWLYLFDFILGLAEKHYIFPLPPSTLGMAVDAMGGVLGIGLLLGTVPVTVNNYRELKRLLLQEESKNKLDPETHLVAWFPILVIPAFVVCSIWIGDARLLFGIPALLASMLTGASAGTKSYPLVKLLTWTTKDTTVPRIVRLVAHCLLLLIPVGIIFMGFFCSMLLYFGYWTSALIAVSYLCSRIVIAAVIETIYAGFAKGTITKVSGIPMRLYLAAGEYEKAVTYSMESRVRTHIAPTQSRTAGN